MSNLTSNLTGGGTGAGFVLFTQADNNSGIYADDAARDVYFAAVPADLARLDTNEFLIIKILDNGFGEIAYQQRDNNVFVDVTSLVQGEQGADGLAGGAGNFTSVDDRDDFFEADDNSLQLQTGLPITVNEGNATTTFRWDGPNAPTSYNRTTDAILFRESSLNSGPGTLFLGIDGTNISSAASALNFESAYGVESIPVGFNVTIDGSSAPGFFELDTVKDVLVADVFDTQLGDPNDFIFPAATLNTYTTGVKVRPATTGTMIVKAYAGPADTDPIVVDAAFSVVGGDIGNIFTIPYPNKLIGLQGDVQLLTISGVDLFGGLQTSGLFNGQTKAFLIASTQLARGVPVASRDDLDQYIDLNSDYVTTAVKTGGLAITTDPQGLSDGFTAAEFTIGVASTSNPTVNTDSESVFTAGQIVRLICNLGQPVANNGYYEVLSHAANILTVRGIGTIAKLDDFTRDQFVNQISTGTIEHVFVSVLRITEDELQVGFGDTSPLQFNKRLGAEDIESTAMEPNVAAANYITQGFNNWTYKNISEANTWVATTWSPELGLFCAVSLDGTNRVMTSPDGVEWTARAAASLDSWQDIVWSPELGLFASVANDNLEFGVQTSSDGISWSLSETPTSEAWFGVAWSPELGLFAIVGADAIATSTDGVTWTNRTTPNASIWGDVVWASELGLFCACAPGQIGAVMTSPDGIVWAEHNASTNKAWVDIDWAPELNLFVCTSTTVSSDNIQTSPDGITWILRSNPAMALHDVVYSSELGLFIVPGSLGVIYSRDGINWANLLAPESVLYTSVAWSPDLGKFAVTKFVSGELDAIFLSPTEIDVNLTDITVTSLNQAVFGTDVGLVCHIPISENTNLTQYDRSPFGGDGVADSGVTITDDGGRFGPGGDFDGTTSAKITVDTTNLVYGTNPRGICIQARADTIATGIDICFAYGDTVAFDGFFIGRKDADLFIGGFGDDFELADFWEVGVWHELVLNYDGTTVKVFDNGEFLHQEVRAWDTVEGEAFIGQQIGVPAESWDGQLANFKMYNRILDPAEIRTGYLRGGLPESSSVLTANNLRVLDTSNNIKTVSLLGASAADTIEVEVHSESDIDDLATAGVITVTGALTLVMKTTLVVSATRFVLSGGGSLVIKGDDYGGLPVYTYSGAGVFVFGDGNFIVNSSVQLVSSSTGTLLDVTTGVVQFDQVFVIGWDDLGAVRNAFALNISASAFSGWGAPLIVGSVQALNIETAGSFAWPTGINLIEVSDPAHVMATMSINGISGEVEATASVIRIDPDLRGSTSVVFLGNAFTGGALFDIGGGSTGTFTLVADASVSSTTITSVSDFSGTARFNFTVGPTLFVGQEVDISGFITEQTYNTKGIITTVGAGFFQISRIAFTGSEASAGAFTSDSVTLTDSGTTLSNGDTVTLDTTEKTNYDGGVTVYNQQTNTVQVNKVFDGSEAGTWDSSGLDQSDPRVLAFANPAIINSHYIGCAFVNDNTTAVTGITNNVFVNAEFGTDGNALVVCSNMERVKLIEDVSGVFECTSQEPFDGSIDYDYTVVSSGGSQEFRFKWQIDEAPAYAGFVDLPDNVEALAEVGGTSTSVTKTQPIKWKLGDRIRPLLTRNSGTSGITIRYATINITQ